jgi:hypothetical protein
MKNFFAIVFASLVTSSACAQFMQAEGEFSSPTVSLTVILLDSEKGVVAAKTEVVSGSCSGSVSGIGNIKGHTLTFSPYVKEEDAQDCKITATFDPAWKQVKIQSQGCSSYSGAECGWEGQAAAKQQPN